MATKEGKLRSREEISPARPRKRRKSRWGNELSAEQQSANAADVAKTAVANGETGDTSGGRKSRWGGKAASETGGSLTEIQKETLAVQMKLQEVNKRLAEPYRLVDSGDRSPSPEPVYNSEGKRTNTREQRRMAKLMAERTELIRKILELNPSLQVRLPAQKAVKKIPIPQARYPDYNFIGLIIGPRGNTQKRMERETGAKIVIRGKGANKSKRDQRPMEGEDEELHVHISGDSQEVVDKATILIEQLLVPQNESANVHKAKQLQELAAINGTQRDSFTCKVCGEVGHKIFQCPNRSGAKWTAADVVCGICGGTNHVDRDCPRMGEKGGVPVPGRSMTKEYESFMAELTGDGRRPAADRERPNHSNDVSSAPRPSPDSFIHPSRRSHHIHRQQQPQQHHHPVPASASSPRSRLKESPSSPSKRGRAPSSGGAQSPPPIIPPGMGMPPMMMPGGGYMPYPMMMPPMYFPPPPFGMPNPWNMPGMSGSGPPQPPQPPPPPPAP